jgi:hypothetical protein
MTPLSPFRIAVIALIAICLFFISGNSRAQTEASLRVESATICRNVLDHEPSGAGTNFPASVGKLYCFTRIVGAQGFSQITHVWYFGDTERARVTLPIGSTSWRTYSSKRIQPHEVGVWYVDVLGPGGQRLTSVTFEIGP